MRWKEQQLYGSSRLGLWQPNMLMGNSTNAGDLWRNVGLKSYELSNHLGNVLGVVSDKRVPVAGGGYEAEMINANDYYAFGSQMPGRSFNLAGSYRYGFNGKENDNEVKGEGNQQDYGMRIYDPRIGKFLSIDPLTKGFPMLTPYQFASNSPIANIDLDGGEAKYYTLQLEKVYNGKGKLEILVTREIEYKSLASGFHYGPVHSKVALPTYKFDGPLGDGKLYNIEEKTTVTSLNGSKNSTTKNMGSIYMPGPGDIEKRNEKNPFPINVKVFGKSFDPNNPLSFKNGGGGKSFSFSLSDWEEMTGLATSFATGKELGNLKLPSATDFMESLNGFMLDQDINKLRKNWKEATIAKEKKREGMSVHCRTCGENFKIQNGELGFEKSKEKAKDTVSSH